jgi:hypothetical protein
MAIQKANTSKTVRQLYNDNKKGKINCSLAIQRNYVWNNEQESELVHTALDGYIILPIVTVDMNDALYHIIDGNQRLTALFRFINGEFAISNKTPELEDGTEINGLKFEDLTDEQKEQFFDNTLISIYILKNITDEQIDRQFYKFNNGTSMSKFGRIKALLTGKKMEFVNQINNTNFFKNVISITEGTRNKNEKDKQVVLETISILMNGYNMGFDELEEFAKILNKQDIPQNIKDLMHNTVKYLEQAFPVYDKKLKQTHIPIIFSLAVRAQNDEIRPEQFGGLIQIFFKNNPSGSTYSNASGAGAGKKEKIKTRLDELIKYYNENISSAPDYKIPEPRITGKRGRPLGSTKNKEEKLADSNPPENPLPLVASPESLS